MILYMICLIDIKRADIVLDLQIFHDVFKRSIIQFQS